MSKKYKNKAHAPYNFVPLNPIVIPGESVPSLDLYYNNTMRLTGYIELNILTKTPLYIRGTLIKDNFIKGNIPQNLSQNDLDKKARFFSPGDIIKIPGSSLRGMVSTLIEIVTFGRFTKTDPNRRLYYREIGDTFKGDDYRDKLNDKEIKVGYLKKEKDKYYIRPAKGFKDVEGNFEPWLILKNREGSSLISPGRMMGKKKYWKIFPPNESETKQYLTKADVKEYLSDNTRRLNKVTIEIPSKKPIREEWNLIQLADKGIFREGVPCFYVNWSKQGEEEDQIHCSIGHTRYFRIPYSSTFKDCIPPDLAGESTPPWTITELMFGKADKIASRLIFEDAVLEENQKNVEWESLVSTKILESPKPTTFQHYLVQNKRELADWNDKDALLRGYKLYWHRWSEIPDEWNGWREKQVITSKNRSDPIRPIKAGTKFKGRIRFENLTKVELGALLFVLNLPMGCAHKLGMGKPLGLGSILIEPKVFISDREQRYSKLFENDSWHLAEEKRETSEYTEQFEDYIKNKIREKDLSLFNSRYNSKDLWETDNLKELKSILSWDNVKQDGWLHEKTSYMKFAPLNEFKKRPILQKPSDIVEQ